MQPRDVEMQRRTTAFANAILDDELIGLFVASIRRLGTQ